MPRIGMVTHQHTSYMHAVCRAGNVYGILPMSTAKQVSIYLMLTHQVSPAVLSNWSVKLQKHCCRLTGLAGASTSKCFLYSRVLLTE
jgi:hypothetical protein